MKQHQPVCQYSRYLLQQLQQLCQQPIAQQSTLVLGCGHSIALPNDGTPSAPSRVCPTCQEQITQQNNLPTLAIFKQLTTILKGNISDSAILATIMASAKLEAFCCLPIDRCLRRENGDLTVAKPLAIAGHIKPCPTMLALLGKTQENLRALKVSEQSQSACTQSKKATPINQSCKPLMPQYTIDCLYRLLRALIKQPRNDQSAWAAFQLSLRLKRDIAHLLKQNETLATVYAQCAHENMRKHWMHTRPKNKNATTLWQACLDHTSVNSFCPISQTKHPRNPVYTNCGHLFDHTAIGLWLQGNDECPCCRRTVHALVSVKLRTQLNRLLNPELMSQNHSDVVVADATPERSLQALRKLIAPAIKYWPFIVTDAIRHDNDTLYHVVWQRGQQRIDLRLIKKKLNASIEALAHIIRPITPRPTPRFLQKALHRNGLFAHRQDRLHTQARHQGKHGGKHATY